MKAFYAVTLLLTLCLGAAAAQGGAGERLTPAEEREARELARLFLERFRETNDIAPPVKELFVEDFAERLRHDADGVPMFFLRREVALRATPAELREFYVAQFNFLVLTLEHWMSRPEGPGDGEGEPTLEQMFPHEVVEVLKSEPHFAAYIAGDKPAPEEPDAAESDEAKPDEAKSEDDDDRFVTSLPMLRKLTSLTEKAVGAFRPHVPPFTFMLEAQRERVGDEHLSEIDAPYAETREDVFYGFPAGTRFIRLNVEPLHDLQLQLYAVRVEDGRLRILAAFPVLGD